MLRVNSPFLVFFVVGSNGHWDRRNSAEISGAQHHPGGLFWIYHLVFCSLTGFMASRAVRRLIHSAGTLRRLGSMSTVPTGESTMRVDTLRLLEPQPQAGPSRISVADKWVRPNGPPVGAIFGARFLDEQKDVWSHNAW
jgi:hypothetical protein